MAFHISGLFQNPNISNPNDISDTAQVSQKGQNKPVDIGSPLTGLKAGTAISGQVVSVEQGNVTLKLSDSSYVTAALKGDVSLQPGSQISFLVNSNQNHQISLSPLFTNMLSGSVGAEQALNAASLPINEKSSAMVLQMMEQGMGIDKESLQAMYKEVISNPNIDSQTVVRLSQMHMAVTEINAEQLHLYDNLKHQLLGSIETIGNALESAFSDLSKTNPSEGQKLFMEILSLLTEENGSNVNGSDSTLQNPWSGKEGIQPGQVTDRGLVPSTTLNSPEEQLKALLTEAGKALSETVTSEGALQETKLYAELGKNDFRSFMEAIAQNSKEGYQVIKDALLKSDVSSTDMLKLIGQLMDENKLDSKILSEPAVGKMFQNILGEKWLLRPEDVADKEKMDSFYNQLKLQTSKLAEASLASLGKESALTQNTTQLSHNIDFMNQLNQTFTYVQIPLKMSGQNANGDLYVYTNKKNLSAKDGAVSAFLHLDMTHLGSVDCYVTMENQKVSTNFKVADDATLDLIMDHIDILNERLEKRGYALKATVSLSEEKNSVIGEIEKQLGAGSVPISKVSFDARA